MSPLRICFLAERQVGIGSAAAALEPLARAIGNAVWADITYYEKGGFIERLALPGRVGGALRGFRQSGAALRGGPFDALFFLTHNPAVLHQVAIGRTPTMLWTDVTPAQLDAQAVQYGHPVDKGWATRILKRALVRRAFQQAALCVGWSEWARKSFIRDYGVVPSRTAVVKPGVDLTQWQPPSRGRLSGLPRLLFVGGDFRRKGGDLLLEVFRAHLRGRCELDIVTRSAVLQEEGIRVHGNVDAGSAAMLEVMRSASAFVLPTLGDCFSIASIEAMAMGLPVVVTDVGGISEIVEHNRSGYLVPPGDGRALREALDLLVDDGALRARQGRAGRQLVEERFDVRKTAAQLFSLLGAIARKDPRGWEGDDAPTSLSDWWKSKEFRTRGSQSALHDTSALHVQSR